MAGIPDLPEMEGPTGWDRGVEICNCEHCTELRRQQERANKWRREEELWHSLNGSSIPLPSTKNLN